MKKTSLQALNLHLFETIEMLKNNSDEKASPNERIDIETARVIANLGKVVVEGYKVSVQAMNIIRNTENPNTMKELMSNTGISEES